MQTFSQFHEDQNAHIMAVLFESDELDEVLGFETFSLLNEKSNVAQIMKQAWGDVKKTSDEEEYKRAVTKAYETAFKLAKESEREFSRGLRKVTQGARNVKILVDIKKLDSFLDKVIARNKNAGDINDVLRSAILVETDDDVDEVVKKIRKDFTVAEFEFKGKKEVVTRTYDEKGKEQLKKKGGDETYGYHGSYHFLVKINGMLAEIQVMTKRLWAFKNQAHKIYDQLRSAGKSVDDAIKMAKQKMSKELFSKGNVQNKNLAARKAGKGRKPRR
jgi:hypothetical protein